MASIINATTTNGVAVQGDNSGSLQLQTNNGTTAVTIDTSQNLVINGDVNLYSAKSFKAYNPANTRFGSFLTNNDGTVLSSFNGSGEPLLLSAPTGYFTVSTNGSERMRIDSSGNLLVNTTSVSTWGGRVSIAHDSSSGVYPFAINNTAAGSNNLVIEDFYRNGTRTGYISNTNNATTYSTSSDYRLKENIAPMIGALAKVAQLKPVTYNWKVDGSAGQGFIAHELAEVCPDAVSGEKDAVDKNGNPEYQGVDTSFLVATLTAAIQELKAELDATKAEVQALKGVA